MNKAIRGNIIDVNSRNIFKGEIIVSGEKIQEIRPCDVEEEDYILPGLVDSHIHIESSMLAPSRFAQEAVKHGTVATVSDPHEIANVLGLDGVDFMIKDGERVPLKFFFGAPSCVPATDFESSGAKINADEIEKLLANSKIKYLSEMMNFPGVLFEVPDVMAKINAAKKYKKPIDGHAPGLAGDDLRKYASAGISTDHECTTIEEAEEKISLGMKIQIREGSAAKDFEALYPLIDKYPGQVMLCSDDKHPDDLIKGHINLLVKRALDLGCDFFNVMEAVTKVPVNHFNLEVGLLQENDDADLIIIDNLEDFNIKSTVIKGKEIFNGKEILFETGEIDTPNVFNSIKIDINDISVPDKGKKINCQVAIDGDLYTGKEIIDPKVYNGEIVQDIENDILKIVVLNRYQQSNPVVGVIKNFGFKQGAIAGSIAHDSHNIIAVGADDKSIVDCINAVIDGKGGISVSDGNEVHCLELPIAGLMSPESAEKVAVEYQRMNEITKEMGTKLTAPFMTLSFMALLVIPELKIGDKGLFEVSKFSLTDLYV